MLSHQRSGSTIRGAAPDERGTVILELAMIAMLLLLLASGAFDYGRAWQTGLTVQEAARAGARVGSSQTTARSADFDAMTGLKSALTSSGRISGLERVVIYRATSANGRVPEICKTSSSTDCQVITGDQFRTAWHTMAFTSATTTTGCLNIATVKNWCPTNRENTQAIAEYYGVWIRYRQDNVFGLIGKSQTLEKYAVMRLEPKEA